jgi:hypothetical protein
VPPLTRVTSVYGSFRARVVAARLQYEGFEVVLRGPLDSPYAMTVGELARIDVLVPADQVDDASYVLLIDQVDEMDELLDDDRPPIPARPVPLWCVPVAAVMLAIVAMPVVHLVRDAF